MVAPAVDDAPPIDVKLEQGLGELSRALGFGERDAVPPVGDHHEKETSPRPADKKRQPESSGDDGVKLRKLHNLTHTPYDPNCPVCRSAKTQCSPHKKRIPDDTGNLPVTKFGDLLTADHVDAGTDGISLKGDHTAIVIADAYTKMIRGYPRVSHNLKDTVAALLDFVGPGDTVGLFYTDGAPVCCRLPRSSCGVVTLRHHIDHKRMVLLNAPFVRLWRVRELC